MGSGSRFGIVVLLLGAGLGPASAQSIYSCVDAKGRRLTADRPIPECSDREQKELTPGGGVKRRLMPTLTALEQAAEDEKARKAAEESARLAEEKKRDRALLIRFPNLASHDKERGLVMHQLHEAIAAAAKRSASLTQQRKKLEAEFEFYKANPARAPASLKRQIEETDQQLVMQNRLSTDQELEKQRLHARFDEELARLKGLWALQAPKAAGAAR